MRYKHEFQSARVNGANALGNIEGCSYGDRCRADSVCHPLGYVPCEIFARAPRRKEGPALAVELGNVLHHPLLLVLSQFRKHGKRENFARRTFGFGQIALAVSEIAEYRLQV